MRQGKINPTILHVRAGKTADAQADQSLLSTSRCLGSLAIRRKPCKDFNCANVQADLRLSWVHM